VGLFGELRGQDKVVSSSLLLAPVEQYFRFGSSVSMADLVL
jgi:hypothetical protein